MNLELRDKDNQESVKTKIINGVLVLKDNNGDVIGRYDPKTNKTKDGEGSIVGSGNLLNNLL